MTFITRKLLIFCLAALVFAALPFALEKLIPVRVLVYGQVSAPGQTIKVLLDKPFAYGKAYCAVKTRRYPFFADGGFSSALVPVPVNARPEASEIKVLIKTRSGEKTIASVPLRIKPAGFRIVRLRLPVKTKKLYSLPRALEVRKDLLAAMERVETRRFWRGLFSFPVPGKIRSPFGETRLKAGHSPSYHFGIDLRAKLGEPVAAANDGVVAVAGNFPLQGNAVVLDHGRGVFTVYYHMSALVAAKGKFVRKGEIIGLAGSTGISTGPHVHWGLSVHGVPVDPAEWTKKEF